jgi:HlyD family secretion protein
MIRLRYVRTAGWGLALGSVTAALFLIEIEDRATGPFQVRPATRAEVRAPVAGFVRVVHCDEGDRVAPGAPLLTLEIPDLDSRLAQKRAEVREATARVRLLEAGARYEEVQEQRQRVERARSWRDLARQDLERHRGALAEELVCLEKQVAQARAELAAAQEAHELNRDLLGRRALARTDYQQSEKQYRVSQARLEAATAEKRAREARGALEAEAELARREKELADAQAALTLLEAGTRPEEIEAERARLARLREEQRYLERQQGQLALVSRSAGLITTPHLREKVGQYVREGDLLCTIEEPADLQAEVVVPEQEVARVRAGQPVECKARALPFTTLTTTVDRIAPAANGTGQGQVTVYCRLAGSAELRPGMTGHARISTGRRSVAAIGIDRALRYVRTEFWW